MKITLNITEDHIKLIKGLNFKRFNDNQYGIDNYDMFSIGRGFLYEDMAYILDLTSHIIPETVDDWDGPKFDNETQDYLISLDEFMVEHIQDIVEILFAFCDKGGIKVGKYTCLDNERIWKYEG